MTGQKQCCANCYFFQDIGLSGQGHCTHPKRNGPGGGPGRLVRRQELACRNGWGDNLFTDPATMMDDRTSDDRLVAQATAAPAQASRAEPAREPDDRLVARDRSPNMAAQHDQDDRAKSMQRGPGDALRRAHERARERQSGAPRFAANNEVAPAAPQDEPTPASDASAVAATRPAPQRSIIPAVPRAETGARHRDDSSIWDEIPEIAADVELPRLRESFRLPGQTAAAQPTESPHQPSRYDLALQKAQEYRLAKGREPREAEDRVTATEPARDRVEDAPRPAPATNDPIDEVVRYEPQRGTELDRFPAAPEPIEGDDAYLDEDYELDRSWQPEAPSRQSGHRWWKAFGRARVFVDDRRGDDRLDVEPPPFERPVTVSGGGEPAPADPVMQPAPMPPTTAPNMTITWDDRTLAPQPAMPYEFASLTYLDDDPRAGDRQLERTIQPARAVASPFAPSTPGVSAGEPAGERIAGTVRRLHRWTYHEARPEPVPTVTDLAPAAAAAPVSPDPDPVAERPSATPPPESSDIDLDAIQAPAFDIRRVIARTAEPLLDMTIEIAPDIPRECGTCRHFRASGNGERGWCTNTWAFPHRPLVNADAVHCTSTIGCWWLPADDDWDPQEYFDWLDQETPRADRMIAALYGEEPERRFGN